MSCKVFIRFFMLRIKRLHTFILQTFLPLFVMTFGICLFIILMQFLWKYIDDMVGKGLELTVLAQMFFYAALTLVPMALPLSILLASLMTFGNLGESFELTAIKASGVSLLKTMKSIVFFIAFIAVIAYFFQNNVMPYSQVKLYTLLHSMRQKSPELDIPEGSFYKEIPGYNLFVKQKDPKTGILHDMMIYNFSKGFENASVTVADSGRLKMSADKKSLVLYLYSGESFQNLREQSHSRQNKNIPYQRETFSEKEVFIDFDANFSMMDESVMQGQYIGKNRHELKTYIDSVTVVSDSVNAGYARSLKSYGYMQALRAGHRNSVQEPDTFKINDLNQYLESRALSEQLSVASSAQSKAETIKNDYLFKAMTQGDEIANLRKHKMELNRKYTLSFACIIFLFIGAPLGAIIRKGGLGTPVVISVLLFIFYYIIDTFGSKMARQGIWEIWQGMWLSSAVLFPLGVFLTHKAINDSVIFNPDTYINAFKRILGKRETRNYAIKEVIMQYPDYPACVKKLDELDRECELYLQNNNKYPGYIHFWDSDFNQRDLKGMSKRMEHTIDELRNSESSMIVGKLMDFPVITTVPAKLFNYRIVRNTCAVLFPIGLACYMVGLHKTKRRKEDMLVIRRVIRELKQEIENHEGKDQLWANIS